jgi:HrpA-like RNA helicase
MNTTSASVLSTLSCTSQDLDEEDAKDRERKAREDAAKSEFERLQADRKLLPIYPYRQQLIDAVHEHQIVIIVGETGSGKTTQVCDSAACMATSRAVLPSCQLWTPSMPVNSLTLSQRQVA